jgi:hypothetical protein
VSVGGGAELEVDAANRIYVLHSYFDPDASFDMDTGLTRFLSNGHLDVSFQSSGTYFAAVADLDDTVPRALGGGRQPFLVRLQNDLVFADGFEWGSAKFW